MINQTEFDNHRLSLASLDLSLRTSANDRVSFGLTQDLSNSNSSLLADLSTSIFDNDELLDVIPQQTIPQQQQLSETNTLPPIPIVSHEGGGCCGCEDDCHCEVDCNDNDNDDLEPFPIYASSSFLPNMTTSSLSSSASTIQKYLQCRKNSDMKQFEEQGTCHSSHDEQEPGQWDIVCGRNSGAYNSVGNRRFRVIVMMNIQRYMDATTREDKTKVIKSIIRTLQDEVGARFLKKTKNQGFVDLNEKEIHNKVGHTMRDMVQQRQNTNGERNVSSSLVAMPNREKIFARAHTANF